MAKAAYLGVAGIARKVKKMYIGVGGVARKVKKAYIGVNGMARLFFEGKAPWSQRLFTMAQTGTVVSERNPDTLASIGSFSLPRTSVGIGGILGRFFSADLVSTRVYIAEINEANKAEISRVATSLYGSYCMLSGTADDLLGNVWTNNGSSQIVKFKRGDFTVTDFSAVWGGSADAAIGGMGNRVASRYTGAQARWWAERSPTNLNTIIGGEISIPSNRPNMKGMDGLSDRFYLMERNEYTKPFSEVNFANAAVIRSVNDAGVYCVAGII